MIRKGSAVQRIVKAHITTSLASLWKKKTQQASFTSYVEHDDSSTPSERKEEDEEAEDEDTEVEDDSEREEEEEEVVVLRTLASAEESLAQAETLLEGLARNRGSSSSSGRADLDRLSERQRRISQALEVLRNSGTKKKMSILSTYSCK